MSRVQIAATAGLVLLVACSAQTTAPSANGDTPGMDASQELLHTVALGDLELRFYGETVPAGISPRYGVQRMAVVTPQGELPYTPQGELFHSDWSFDIVSPDGSKVLLLQDHYGPYHVVSAENLQAYLINGEPNHEFGQLQPGSNAWVHEQARWVSDSEISYVAGLTTVAEYTFSIPE